MSAPNDFNKQTNPLHWVLAGSLVLIGIFVASTLIIVNSQTADNVTGKTSLTNNDPTIDTVYANDTAYAMTDTYNSSSPWTPSTYTSTTLLHVNGEISDADGYGDVTNVRLAFYIQATGNPSNALDPLDNNQKYHVATCDTTMKDADTIKFDCPFAPQYYITGGVDYIAGIEVMDATIAVPITDYTHKVKINKALGYFLAANELNYGAMHTGDTSSDKSVSSTNRLNTAYQIKIKTNGNWICDGTGSWGSTYSTFSSSTATGWGGVGTFAMSSTTDSTLDATVPIRTNETTEAIESDVGDMRTVHTWLKVPTAGAADTFGSTSFRGMCSTVYIFTTFGV